MPTDGSDDRLCLICQVDEATVRFKPCLHAIICSNCAPEFHRRGQGCSICRAAISEFEVGKWDQTFAKGPSDGLGDTEDAEQLLFDAVSGEGSDLSEDEQIALEFEEVFREVFRGLADTLDAEQLLFDAGHDLSEEEQIALAIGMSLNEVHRQPPPPPPPTLAMPPPQDPGLSPRCSNGHFLNTSHPSASSYIHYNCNSCHRPMRTLPGRTLHSCRGCNYDLCGECFTEEVRRLERRREQYRRNPNQLRSIPNWLGRGEG
ncbi:hypothetical protein TrVE_jg12768 [Triparma verrucosa]|uniref:RING-type domain-containing protein n=1 Tax=Triparma verrucosa TaxID=1606542 RepID=A0A9W7F7Z2_9STRA|nr:hypothetical protein TrVE_jg12768 [Triparma verrucosa]